MNKNISKKITAIILILATIFNYGDFSFLSCLGNLTEVKADETLTSAIIKEEFENRLVTEKGWISGTAYSDYAPTDAFWQDTSEKKVMRVNDAGVWNTSDSTTTDRSDDTGKKIINENITDANGNIAATVERVTNDYGTRIIFKDGYSIDDILTGTAVTVEAAAWSAVTINSNNFKSSPCYEGKDGALNHVYYTLKYDAALYGKNTNGNTDTTDTPAGGWYRNYYVSTADELRAVMQLYKEAFTNISRADATETPDGRRGAFKIGVELLCDIDMGGADSNKVWSGFSNTPWFEINGNGHHIYNGRYSGGYFFTNSMKKVIIHDVIFSNQYIGRNGGIFGTDSNLFYFDNVDFENCVAKGSKSTTIVIGQANDGVYFNNCMARNCYVLGNGTGHCAVFAAYNKDGISVGNSTYIEDDTSADGYYYIDIPESDTGATDQSDADTGYTSYEKFEQYFVNGATVTYDGKSKTLASTFPTIYKNSMVIDSAVYELSTSANHSGTFVSCTQGLEIFKNCFTNSEIYSAQRGGVFMGCAIGSGDGFYYELDGTKTFVNTYFENCFTSGLLEGQNYEGGFIGSIFNDYRSDGTTIGSSEISNSRGICVFKNCYSTSSVGMQYTGKYVGGFVGLVLGNMGAYGATTPAPYGGNFAHKFINCYAAGEVGGVSTVATTDDTNTNTIGGFAGSYVIRDWTKTYGGSASYNDIPPVYTGSDRFDYIPMEATNCYYDMQTTAMRERDIGNFYEDRKDVDGEVYSYNYKHCGTVPGITGVYTQKSDVKKVNGVKGIQGLTDDVDMKDNSVWNHKQGYYPYLTVFTNGDAKTNFGTTKATIATLYTKASVATVFLDHWDTKMDGTSGEIVNNEDATVYDTVRDISSKFEFTSGGNSSETNIGWQIADIHNNESGFVPYVGGCTDSTNTTAKGISVDFSYLDESGAEAELTKTYTPEVLGLDIEERNNDYVFKCNSFAEGKQFVKVTACLDEDYATWTDDAKKYFDYTDKYDKYSVLKTSYINYLNQTAYNGLTVNSTDAEVQAQLKAYLQAELFNGATTEDGSIKDPDNIDVNTITGRVYRIQVLYDKINDNTLTADDKTELEGYLGLAADTADSDLKSAAAEYMRFDMEYYPLEAPTRVEKPSDFDDRVSGENGLRYLRLIPTAYLYAGDVMNVKVTDERGAGGALKNTVTVDGTTMSKFDHTIGVLYSSAQANDSDTVKTTLGNKSIYSTQTVVQNTSKYYNLSTNKFTGNNSTFALYDYFPTVKDSSVKESTITASSGLGSLINQVLWGDFHGDGDSSLNGKTMVKVYPTKAQAVDDSGTTYELVMGDEVDMTNTTNLAKWSGQTYFESSDTGYYYMIYYWRLNDGRYLEEYKLVNITSSQFNMGVRTGVAGATEDTFAYDSNGKIAYTYIDCDLVSSDDINEETIANHTFPGDLYDNSKNWDEYANDTYDEYGEYLDYNNVDYWYKARSAVISSSHGCVAWRKNSDYALIKLMVEVRDGNTWHPMSVTIENNDEKYLIDDNADVTYSYTYNSYSITQNPDTKQFSVVATSNSVKSFKVQMSQGADKGYVHYINFDFVDETGTNTAEFNDDIRVTALFKNISAQIEAEEDVYIDDGVTINNLASGAALYTAQEYRSVDNTNIENANNKKVVLFGDNLIFCKRVINTGLYVGNDVVVTEEIPEGIVLDEDSVKVYKQARNVSLANEDTYNAIEECAVKKLPSSAADYADYSEEYYYYKINYDKNNNPKSITWVLNPVRSDTDYYAMFEGKAVSDDGDIDYAVKQNQYNSSSDYSSIFINGDVSDTTKTGDYNCTYNSVAYVKINTVDTLNDDGSMHRKVTFTKNSDDTFVFSNITSELNNCSVGKITVTILGKEYTGTISKDEDKNTFTVPLSGITLSNGDSIVLEYDLTPSTDAVIKTYGDTVDIVYTDTSAESGTALQNSLKREFNSSTNTVTADARWLYMDITKNIDEADDEQAFVFKVTCDGSSDYILTDVKCNTENDGTYSGTKTVLIPKRGKYVVAETDWAETDYDVEEATFSKTDVDLTRVDGSEDADGTSYAIPTDDENEEDKGDYKYSFNIPRAMYKSTAIPMWLTDTVDATSGENEGLTETYPTISCTNVLSEYAWLTSQRSVENRFTTSEDQEESTTEETTEGTTAASTNPASEPQASSLNVVTKDKKDDEDDE